ncbi:MAG: DUF1598 domain-containing protein [Pirellulaceae bacterium]|jgi:hypothetical protein|nr:DUF1598 domain-containing protein [Pirellulaceae bacterium]
MSHRLIHYSCSTRPNRHLLVLLLLGSITGFGIIGFGTRANGDDQDFDRQILAHLSAGEFGPARQIVDQVGDAGRRDAWLRGIADAQMQTGSRYASLNTAFDIQNGRSRGQAMESLAAQPIMAGPRGGAALADFDSLIELITATIAPDSWDDVGGPGAIESFPGGVFVDGSGLLKRVGTAGVDSTLSALRASSSSSTGNRQVRRKSALRKVSLTRLEQHVQLQWALGRQPDEAMKQLAGLQEIKYLLFYPETGDIVIAGPAGDWMPNPEGRAVSVATGRPVLQLDDLVVVLRNSLDGDGRFGCSINPVKENLASVQAFSQESAESPINPSRRDAWLKGLRDRLGKQEISVFGIDPRTRAARTLVEADYHMKLVGMGLQEGTPGVTSYLDSIKVPAGVAPPSMDVLRWWFTLNFDHIKMTKARDAFQLYGPGVKVLSENELLTERGKRVHTGASDELNQEFANSFTTHFDALAEKYPVYAELRNVFSLALVAAVIRSEDMANRIEWEALHWRQPDRYRVDLGETPREVESVINHRLINGRHIVVGVSGGVSVDANHFVSAKSFKVDDYGRMQSSRLSSTPKQSPRDAWWWD